jgi:hypothetical protein
MLRIVLIIGGCLSLALGVIGIFIPLLPTTPFLLLASYLFLKSSVRLRYWLINHKYLGSYIQNYQIHKAIPLKIKITSVILLWITILTSAFLFVDKTWLRLILIGIAIAVSLHILSYKTLKKE